MESSLPDGQPTMPDVISIDDSDNDEPVLSQRQSGEDKKPLRGREMTGELRDHTKHTNMNGSSSSGIKEILQWRAATLQEMKMEGKKAYRTHWQLYEKSYVEASERCLALQNENERLKENLVAAALVEMQGKETERQNSELEEKCKKLEEQLGKAQALSNTPNASSHGHGPQASLVEEFDDTSSAWVQNDAVNPECDVALQQRQTFEKVTAELTQVVSALPSGTDTSIVERMKTHHRDTMDELRKQRLEVASLKSEMGMKQARIAALTAELEKANARATAKPARADGSISITEGSTAAELELVQAKLADVSQKLLAANTQKMGLQEEIEQHEESKNDMDREMLALRDQLARVKEDLEWAENEKEEIGEDIIYIMETSQLSLRDAFRKQKRDIEDLTRRLEEAREAVMLHQDDERDATLLQEQLEGKIERIQETNKAKQSRINALENEVKKLKQQMKHPRPDHVSTTKSAQHRDVESKLRICESDKQALQEKLDDLEGVDAELKVLKKQFRLAEEKQQRMEKKEAQLRTERNDFQKQFGSASDGMEKRQRQIDRLTADLKDAQSLSKAKDAEIKALDRRTTSLSSGLEVSADSKIKLEEKVVALEERMEALDGSLSFERDLSTRLKELLKASRDRASRNDTSHSNETPTRTRNRSVSLGVTPSSSLTSSAKKRGPELDLFDEELREIAVKLCDKVFEGPEGLCMACSKQLKVGDMPAVAPKDRVAHLVEHHPNVLRKVKAAGIVAAHKRPRTESTQL
ncbi:hypothetical protein QFC21_004787 [Naganishia friedmannii]|uniref:Uncharacterized protein n=1 Tax=Naganishia friedmannii TaxID=89922 RepID=A0ACC2VEC5_9TREE|nr:hypothetical protein QFC21_004787 [Naganishia friedmannii]